MIRNLAKLSVFVLLILPCGNARADSSFYRVRGNACEDVVPELTRAEIRYKAYDKAALLAIKNAKILPQIDEHNFNVLAYRLADKALNDVTIITTKDDENKICVEVTGNVLANKVSEILKTTDFNDFNPQNVAQIAREVNKTLPKSLYETDETLPLFYIKDIEFYNHKTSSKYTEHIKEKLSFEPDILVTETQKLADYIVIPKLLRSKMDNIDGKNHRYNMSVAIELQKPDGTIVLSETQNRYIIIEQDQKPQDIAQRLLTKLIDDCLQNLTGKINSLTKY